MEPTTAAATSGGGMGGIFFIMIAFLAIFMFLSTRSQKKRDNEQKKLIKSLVKGDKVVLLGGIVGTVSGFNGDIIEVKVSETTKFSVLPHGIVTVYKDAPAAVVNGAK
ncbi:MAG: preprotein translocase subunit YajC [Elusimicrobiota bacterium]|jgi:preprotein translocase subunit YajC|nr:preprotein translocase subunit YajC [Elusimicrobiota bacterium]